MASQGDKAQAAGGEPSEAESKGTQDDQPSLCAFMARSMLTSVLLGLAVAVGVLRGLGEAPGFVGYMGPRGSGEMLGYWPETPPNMSGGMRIFTQKELLKFDGTDENLPLYLVVVGQVYDVSNGRQYYSKGEGYNIFAGKDCSRAFVTGEFDANNRTADAPAFHDIFDFTVDQLLGIEDWRKFYRKGGDEFKYYHIGYLSMDNMTDGYFDTEGKLTDKGERLEKMFEEAVGKKEIQKDQVKKYPGCNSQFKTGEGGKVWCGDETLVPRKGQMEWDSNSRCACYDKEFADSNKEKLSVYDNCTPEANSCPVPA